MMTVHCRLLAALAVVFGLAGWGATAHADWAACQRKPTRACLLEEALRGDGAPLAGKDRLDILILAGAAIHPEYATDADIDEALRQAKAATGYNAYYFANLAIRGLVARKRTQEAADLVASFPPRTTTQMLTFTELTRALAQAGDLDTAAALLDRMAPALGQGERDMFAHYRVVESVKTLAEAGKTEDALLVIMQVDPTGLDVAEMQLAVAQAYAARGDSRRAQRLLELAGKILEGNRRYASGSAAEMNRWSLMCLSALRGDAQAVRTALQQLGPEPIDRLAAGQRTQGYQRLIASLLKTKQFPLALEIAKTAPESVRDQALLLVDAESAQNGRIDEARAALSLLSDKMDPKRRSAAVRTIAVAMVKTGKLAAAVEMAAQESDLTGRKAMLFAIAQALPQ